MTDVVDVGLRVMMHRPQAVCTESLLASYAKLVQVTDAEQAGRCPPWNVMAQQHVLHTS